MATQTSQKDTHSQAVELAGEQATQPPAVTGLQYVVASSLSEVEQAWNLVYRSYVRSGLIRVNHAQLHTVPEAIGRQAMVALGRIGPVVASTISAYLDSPAGLPLDKVYPDEMAMRRHAGRKLAEGGLFADRRAQLTRSADSLFELMRFVVFYAYRMGADDLMIGVHPRHAPFYRRFLGFEIAGPEKRYELVNENPVVLMRMDLALRFNEEPRKRGVRFFEEHPLYARDFAERYTFDERELRGTRLEEFRLLAEGPSDHAAA